MFNTAQLLELEQRLSDDPGGAFKDGLVDRLQAISRRLAHERRALAPRERQTALLGAQLSVEAAIQSIRLISP